ncbi:MAG: SDR family oxidoreductase [Halieaceae bacterium]|nr:SDR family oxidoreductase [Halieaceae bacterium]MCP4466063.1 SDR family oxidoreductase [Halieaceae bacterium]MCP4843169.1 SDR family oxidoreductase [Halieaceae bacterium]MDG2412500.1 SDR family NAD(P)-dependent oxidoreductase [Halioglobus sp.]
MKDNRRFEGRVAIVTGASMGIGRATAMQLAEEGAIVVGCARRKPKLDELVDAIAERGGKFISVGLDVGDTDGFAGLIKDIATEYGRLDVLVNNAPSVIGGMVVDQSLDDWKANFGIGVDSVFVGVQAAMRVMIAQQSGAIVNISSVSSLRAGTASGGYGAAKAALNQFSQCAAMEAAPHNVRINVVAPGAVDTPGLNAATGKNPHVKKVITDAIPMQRAATPAEISAAICFLSSDEASFITGVILPVDGGKTPQLYVPSFDITNLDNQAENR